METSSDHTSSIFAIPKLADNLENFYEVDKTLGNVARARGWKRHLEGKALKPADPPIPAKLDSPTEAEWDAIEKAEEKVEEWEKKEYSMLTLIKSTLTPDLTI
jgi:hypothetical protein